MTKSSRRKPIKFKGFDWTELLQLEQVAVSWPKLPKDFEHNQQAFLNFEDQVASYLINEYLNSLCYDEERKKERERAAKYVRKFCQALAGFKGMYDSQVYAAMAKIKHDETLFRWVTCNLEGMWT